MKKEKKSIIEKLFNVISSLIIIFLLIGIGYALYHYNYEGKQSSISNSGISLEFLEGNDVIDVSGALPMSDEEGKNQVQDFDFVVTTETAKTMSIGYNLVIEKLPPTEGYTSLEDKDIKIYLADYETGEELILTSIGDINSNYILWSDINKHNKDSLRIQKKYKLKVWIDQSLENEAKNWDLDTKLEYKFKIGTKTNLSAEGNTYKVKYNANGGTGTMDESEIPYNENGKLQKNTFTKEGYNFIGWSTEANSEKVEFTDEQTVKNLPTDENGIANLYAVWKDVTAPSVNITRSDYNTFNWTASDTAGIAGYQITNSSEKPTDNWITTGTLTSGTYDIENNTEKTYYVWVKDEAGNTTNALISSYKVTVSEKGSSCIIDTLGQAIESSKVVLSGSEINIDCTEKAGYNTLTVKAGGKEIPRNSSITISENTLIETSAIANTYKVKYNANGGVLNNIANKIISKYSESNTEGIIKVEQPATSQTKASTEYRYSGNNNAVKNYVKFNNETWRIIGVFDVDDGTGKIEKRAKIIRDTSIGSYSWDSSASTINNGNGINQWGNSGTY